MKGQSKSDKEEADQELHLLQDLRLQKRHQEIFKNFQRAIKDVIKKELVS